MLTNSAEGLRRFYRDISGSLVAAASATTSTLVTAKNANSTIFIQNIVVYVTTDAAQSWTFQDSASTPVVVAAVTTSPGVNTRWEFDFGDVGMPLTEGKNFVMNVSAAGLAGNIEWYGYSKLSSAIAVGSNN